MAAPPSSSSGNGHRQSRFEVPKGWILVTKPNRKGETVKYYTNILGQRFYNESDLARNIKYSKERGFNIYTPDFKPPTTGPFAMPSREAGRSTSENKECENLKKRKEVASHHVAEGVGSRVDDEALGKNEIECARALLEISGQRNVERVAENACAPIDDEALDENEIECARALSEISGQRNVERRASRRLTRRQPELQVDVDFNRALEYIIIKDNHRQ